jgi:hypothetical protein
MKVKEALTRLAFTIQKQNKPNATDAEAFNKILWFVNESIEQNPNRNICFAKLYIWFFLHNIKAYQSLDMAQKRVHDVLDMPIDLLYEMLTLELNTMDLYDLVKNGTMDYQIVKNHKESWDLETVEQNTNAMITLALKTYSKV